MNEENAIPCAMPGVCTGPDADGPTCAVCYYGKRIANLERAYHAAINMVELLKRIRKAGPPPHTDYWHQALDEAEEALQAAKLALGDNG